MHDKITGIFLGCMQPVLQLNSLSKVIDKLISILK